MADSIKIAVKVNGGFGTILVRANFLHCLYEYLGEDDVRITAFGHRSQTMNDAIFKGQPSIYSYYPENEWANSKNAGYDLRFTLDLFPNLHEYNKKLYSTNEKFRVLVDKWRRLRSNWEYELYFRKLRESKPYMYTRMIIEHKTVLNSADVDGLLEIGSEYRMPILTDSDREQVLEKFGLKGKKFITFQRGINPKLATTENPKMWPLEYYEKLIVALKEEFSDYVLVQLGESAEHCKALKGIDVNLLGQTSWDDLKIILKEATLHIDGECGMVHLRKALHAGPSVVLFGPTPLAFFGYEGNLNLKSNGCYHWCAELKEDWEYRCLRGENKAPCLWGLKPEIVFEEIKSYMNGDSSHLYHLEDDPGTRTKELIATHKFDSEWIENYLSKDSIWDYELIKLPLRSLKCSVFNGESWDHIPLCDSPVYQFAKGNKEPYLQNMKVRNSKLSNNIHSVERFESLIRSVEENGYNDEAKIVIGPDNVIRDGQHRAAIQMYLLGEDAETDVIRVYRS